MAGGAARAVSGRVIAAWRTTSSNVVTMSIERMMVYVAGPLTSSGLVWHNTREVMKAANKIIMRGHFPVIPHLSFVHAMSTEYSAGLPEEYWLQWGLVLLERCDSLFRVPGKSSGSDSEVAHAICCGLPVYFRMDDIPIAQGAPWESNSD